MLILYVCQYRHSNPNSKQIHTSACTVTQESISCVCTFAVIFTGLTETVVNILLTVITDEAGSTCTLIAVV